MSTQTTWRTTLVALAVALGVLLPAQADAAGTTFVVTLIGDEADLNTEDGRCDIDPGTDTFCTLRAAIQQANATPAHDRIEFDIPGDGPHTINPASSLLIFRPVTIDGYTEPGATPNTLAHPTAGSNATLAIRLRGPGETSNVHGLDLTGPAQGTVIKGLAIANFHNAIQTQTSDVKIEGNFIGTDANGVVADGNGTGVYVVHTQRVTIGGTAPEMRNIVSGNAASGINLFDGKNVVTGNLIGTKKDGSTALGNAGGGVVALGTGNTIGDVKPGNGTTGANVISFNGGSGVVIASGTRNRVMTNRMVGNVDRGIDLYTPSDASTTVTPNDDKDADDGSNRLQNFPVLTGASTLGSATSIEGVLDSKPSTAKRKRSYVIQFFRSAVQDVSGHGEADAFLGQITVTTNRKGHAEFAFAPGSAVPVGQYVTATATDARSGDTSEFGPNREVVPRLTGD